jgi:hypothetical protein
MAEIRSPADSDGDDDNDGKPGKIAYRVRLLCDQYVVDSAPLEVEHHAGEVILMIADDAVHALAEGGGVLVGEIIGGHLAGPPICVFCGAAGYGDCACPPPPDPRTGGSGS